MQHVWSDHVSRAEGLIDSKFTEHHRNIALATKVNAAICTVGLASLNLSSAGYHACAALFHSETGFSIHPGAGNGNCIAMREAFGSIKTKRICAFWQWLGSHTLSSCIPSPHMLSLEKYMTPVSRNTHDQHSMAQLERRKLIFSLSVLPGISEAKSVNFSGTQGTTSSHGRSSLFLW